MISFYVSSILFALDLHLNLLADHKCFTLVLLFTHDCLTHTVELGQYYLLLDDVPAFLVVFTRVVAD